VRIQSAAIGDDESLSWQLLARNARALVPTNKVSSSASYCGEGHSYAAEWSKIKATRVNSDHINARLLKLVISEARDCCLRFLS